MARRRARRAGHGRRRDGRCSSSRTTHDAAEVLARSWRAWGHEVRVALDGRRRARVVEHWSPDVVVSDIGLPQMDGYEVARRLRERPDFATVKLIALSGYGREQDKWAAAEAGFDHHLVKPPDLAVLADLIARDDGAAPRAARANA